ncbi:hypothetical protein [Vibrio sp. CK2-1]|uniref:hypothetical protein n=1 Tax=Vibrio sp. CK2-1 TaxID=2912249 RepID=UPI001F1FB1E6|nr:hypothetical protein [Vibrio sp. CK2-1]MCF7355570.1 hypothetical protein [Vibrio sp. CK2-1]
MANSSIQCNPQQISSSKEPSAPVISGAYCVDLNHLSVIPLNTIAIKLGVSNVY